MIKIQKLTVTIFLIFGLVFGLLTLVLTPKCYVPDGEAHFYRASEVAHGVFYNSPNKTDYTFHGASGYSPVMYFASALGLKLGSLISTDAGFYIGRFFNLALWLAMIALAISLTPVFKPAFMFAALLPMSVQLAASYSADCFTNAFTFLFFAFVFKCIFDKSKLKKSDLFLLILMSMISAFTKGAVYPIFLFIFLPLKKHKYLFTILCLFVALFLTGLWSAFNFSVIGNGAEPEYSKFIIFHRPPIFIWLLIKTVIMNFSYYIRSGIGMLCNLDVRFSLWVYVLTALIFLSGFLFFPEKKISDRHRYLSFAVITCFTILLHSLLFITWTPAGSAKIVGIQGRYFLPILPYFFILLAQNKECFSEKFVKYYYIFYVIYIFALLSYSCIILYKYFL